MMQRLYSDHWSNLEPDVTRKLILSLVCQKDMTTSDQSLNVNSRTAICVKPFTDHFSSLGTHCQKHLHLEQKKQLQAMDRP